MRKTVRRFLARAFTGPFLLAADRALVPASSGIGVLLMIVLFIGAAAFFMRRRSGE